MGKVRNVVKNRAGMEDLLQGRGAADQTRGGAPTTVTKIDIALVVNSTAELQALNTEEYNRARIYSTITDYQEYVFDPDATAGILPDEGPGYWVIADSFGVGVGAPEFTAVATPTYATQVLNYRKSANVVYVDIHIEYSGLNTTDTNLVALSGLPVAKEVNASFIAQLDAFTCTAFTAPFDVVVGNQGTATQLGFYDRTTGSAITYNSGKINTSGVLKLGLTYREA